MVYEFVGDYLELTEFPRTVNFSELLVSTDERVSDFYASSWQRGDSAMPLLVVRFVLTACALGILIWSLIEGASRYWLIYLTSWGLVCVAAMMTTGLCVSFAFLCKKPSEPTVLPWYVYLYWVTFNVAAPISLMITALYWILLYKPAIREELGIRGFWLDICSHGFTSCIVVAELLISRTPVRAAHFYQSLCLGVSYVVFTFIYYVAGGTDMNGNEFIYEVLNWEYPKRSCILVIISVAVLIILYMMLWSLALCRDKISIALVRTTTLDLSVTDPTKL